MPKIKHKKTGEELDVTAEKWNDMKAKRLHLNFRVVPEPVKVKTNFTPPEIAKKVTPEPAKDKPVVRKRRTN